ncbi:Thiopurine S-methyltransferase family protein [Xylariaceae sp. FL0016]|nr:Thiopurine S-methyltransferase family protein [Xylariaceae sp. FL0016]
MAQQPQPTRTLVEHFSDKSSPYKSKWNDCWNEAWTPWDRGGHSEALNDILSENRELFGLPASEGRKTALVPGCGRGHDVLLLASLGYDTVGLDLSTKATEEAKQHAAKTRASGHNTSEPGVEASTTFLSGDFFDDDWREVQGVSKRFDLIFDYTFFCALQPSERPAWANRMQQLLAPGGRLVCLEWPTEKDPSEPGPPWASPPSAYEKHLARPQDGDIKGMQRLLHVKPKRTHPAGIDEGRIKDWIAVWVHRDEST